MKKIILTLLLLLLATTSLFAQMFVTEFPKIGYADLYWLHKATTQPSYDPNYYYAELNELGLTHVVSPADNVAMDKSGGIKFLDYNFKFSPGDAAEYARAAGNHNGSYEYQVGGINRATIWEDNNWGFGLSDFAKGQYSRWVFKGDIGKHNESEISNEGEDILVSYASVTDDEPGLFLYLEPNLMHYGRGYENIKVKMLARINNTDSDSSDVVARVHIFETTTTSSNFYDNIYNSSNKSLTDPPSDTAQSLSLTTIDNYHDILASDFNSSDDYQDIYLGSFYFNPKTTKNEIRIELEWMKKRDLYVDEFYIQDYKYEKMFVTNPTGAESDIGTNLTANFGGVYTHDNYEHLYYDEPKPIEHRAQGKVSEIAENVLVGKYINGATGGYWNYFLQWINKQRRLPYVMYDLYPIFGNADTVSLGGNSIQVSYDYLIEKDDGLYEGERKFRGLRQAINMAQNYNNNFGLISDDIPFVHTIQVQAENLLDSSGNTDSTIFRAPTPNEILTQGNLSICYGAKGIQYFLVTTLTAKSERSYYGLFDDDSTDRYDGIHGLVQDPASEQFPNKRFYAVKKLNQHIDKISSTLLQLIWKEAYSIHKSSDRTRLTSDDTFITSITTAEDISLDETFVELGLFKKTTEYTNDNLEYFYVVNRRSLSSESRDIEIEINKGSSSYDNWIVKEIGTDNSWIINKTDDFKPSFTPGEGKLFKLEPLFISSSYTLSGNVSVESDAIVPITRNLTIEEGTNIIFNNSSSLIVDGILNVNGTSSNKVVFDFQQINFILNNSIKVEENGNASILNTLIKNANNGLFINEGVVNLDNSEIFNCRYGIHLYRTNYSDNSSFISNSHIHDSSVDGIILNTSTAYFSNNEINNNSSGLYCYSYSSPYLAPNDNNSSNSAGYNNFHHNWVGIETSSYSNPWLGRETCISFGGNNSFTNNYASDVYLNNNSNSTVYAENNYWGGGAPASYVGSGCSFDYTPYLTSVPQQDQSAVTSEEDVFDSQFAPQLSKANNSSDILSLSKPSIPSGYNDKWSIEWKLLYARNLMRVKKYSSASKICEDVITNNQDSSLSYLALDLLHQSRMKSKSKFLFSQFVREKTKLKAKKQIYGVAELLEAVGEKENRILTLDNIAKKYKSTPLVEFVLFQKFMYYLYEENNLEKAKSILLELGKQFPKSKSYLDSQRHLGKDIRETIEPKLTKGVSTEGIVEIPKNYELHGNYPNPFNPSTTISYALPYNSNVEITIYDITGKVVKTFAEQVQSAGYQNIVWNGTNEQGSRVSSGVYFYRFKATSLENNGKVFEKTAKMLLLK